MKEMDREASVTLIGPRTRPIAGSRSQPSIFGAISAEGIIGILISWRAIHHASSPSIDQHSDICPNQSPGRISTARFTRTSNQPKAANTLVGNSRTP
jgi:hypothetical protein